MGRGKERKGGQRDKKKEEGRGGGGKRERRCRKKRRGRGEGQEERGEEKGEGKLANLLTKKSSGPNFFALKCTALYNSEVQELLTYTTRTNARDQLFPISFAVSCLPLLLPYCFGLNSLTPKMTERKDGSFGRQ